MNDSISTGCWSHLATRAAVSLQVFDELWSGSVSDGNQRCTAIGQPGTSEVRDTTKAAAACLNSLSGSQCTSHTSVPGVGSQTVRNDWTQTGDGHDADAQVQALVACPGLLPLCNDWKEKKEGVDKILFNPKHSFEFEWTCCKEALAWLRLLVLILVLLSVKTLGNVLIKINTNIRRG